MRRIQLLCALLLAALLAGGPTAVADGDEVCFDTEGLVCYDPHPQPGEPGDGLDETVQKIKDRLP